MLWNDFSDRARWPGDWSGGSWTEPARRPAPRRAPGRARSVEELEPTRRSTAQRIPVETAQRDADPPPLAAEETPAAAAQAPIIEERAEPAPPAEHTTAPPATDGKVDESQRLRHALQELEAAKQRVARDADRVLRETRAKLIGELLPVLDNLDRSIDAARTGSDEGIVEGVRLVRGQFEQVLSSYGLERIDAEGQRFDPAIHEAIGVAQVQSPAEHDHVVVQLAAGYRFGEQVLRPARVQVGKLAGGRSS